MKKKQIAAAVLPFCLLYPAVLGVVGYATGNLVFVKPFVGLGQVHFAFRRVSVFVNEKKWKAALLFDCDYPLAGTKILYILDKDASFGRHILLVNSRKKLVALPNASQYHYNLVAGRVLFQSDSGCRGVLLDGSKTALKVIHFMPDADRSVSFDLTADKTEYAPDLPLGRWKISGMR